MSLIMALAIHVIRLIEKRVKYADSDSLLSEAAELVDKGMVFL